jgi:hypothetical protein
MRLHVGFGLLTVRRIRDICSLSSWRPASVENGYEAKLPKNPASMGLTAGQNDMCINSSAYAVTSSWRLGNAATHARKIVQLKERTRSQGVETVA